MSLISINEVVVEMFQNQVATSGKWKYQKSCVGPSVRIGRPVSLGSRNFCEIEARFIS
jgi:hypothetical protein